MPPLLSVKFSVWKGKEQLKTALQGSGSEVQAWGHQQ